MDGEGAGGRVAGGRDSRPDEAAAYLLWRVKVWRGTPMEAVEELIEARHHLHAARAIPQALEVTDDERLVRTAQRCEVDTVLSRQGGLPRNAGCWGPNSLWPSHPFPATFFCRGGSAAAEIPVPAWQDDQMALIWLTDMSVEEYLQLGQDDVLRPRCLSCKRTMQRWSGYQRAARQQGVDTTATQLETMPIPIRRFHCPDCNWDAGPAPLVPVQPAPGCGRGDR